MPFETENNYNNFMPNEEELKKEFHKWGHSICNDWMYQDVNMDELANWWLSKMVTAYATAFEIGYKSGSRVLEESIGKENY